LARLAKQGRKYAGQQRRYVWHKPVGTLTTGGIGIGNPYLRSIGCHPLYTRTFSLLEYKRLASFPDDFKFVGWQTGYKRIGNSVPPLFMKAIAKHIQTEILNKMN